MALDLTDVQKLFDSKAIIFVLGGIVGHLISVGKNRLKIMKYTVQHERVAFAANDAIFGNIQVTWQGNAVTNLFFTTITLENESLKDYENLKFKIWTSDDTVLLNQSTELLGTVSPPRLSDEYSEEIRIAPGAQPTALQYQIYNHQREFILSAFNRGQKTIVRLLTHPMTAGQTPTVWLDMNHPGVKVEFRLIVPEIHGVPVKTATLIGFFVCIATAAASISYVSSGAAIGVICLSAGLFTQSIGAYLYKLGRFLWRLIVG